jgi:hypothetical protein
MKMHQRITLPKVPFVRSENLNSRTRVEDAFVTRIANNCKSVGIRELGDFENNTLEIIPHLGSNSYHTILDTLREAGVMCIEEKIFLLRKKQEMIVKYQTAKKGPFGDTLKREINQIQV